MKVSSHSDPALVLLDFETTGLDPKDSEIIEIGAIRWPDGARFQRLIRPKRDIPPLIERLTGITPAMLSDQPWLEDVAAEFAEFVGDLPFVAHNASMEQGFLDRHLSPLLGGRAFDVYNSIDPIALAFPEFPSHSMESLRQWCGLSNEGAHRALPDCESMEAVLHKTRETFRRERPYLQELVGRLLKGWWWNWFFDAESRDLPAKTKLLVQLHEREPLGDLRQLRSKDSEKESGTTQVPVVEVDRRYQGASQGEGRRLEPRPQQLEMSHRVLNAFNSHSRVAIEAPTGTGKSIAYLLPGVLWARESGTPLVISTHSKSLQDQLLEKDIPKVQEITGIQDLKATTVKGQENYLCLRKLSDWVESLTDDAPLEERWCAAFLVAYHSVCRTAELDRISQYLRGRFEMLNAWIERTRSHHTTTQGPSCSFYKVCHFFDSARLAHQSDVVIANHALVFQWPSQLPAIRSVVFDEAQHLEERLTESFSARISEEEITETLDRLERRRGGRRGDDLAQLGFLLSKLGLTGRYFGRDPQVELPTLADRVRTRVNEVRILAPSFVAKNREGLEGYEEVRVLTGDEKALIEAFRNLEAVVSELRDWLLEGVSTAEARKHPKTDPLLDLLANYAERFQSFSERISRAIPPAQPTEQTENDLRLLHWLPRDQIWKISAQPIDVSKIGAPFFQNMKGVVLTSATLSAGSNPTFITDRIGLELTEKLTQLPSPYPLEKQAVTFIPQGLPQPGTLAHLDSLIAFTAETARLLGGRTLLLMTSNRRMRYAADELRLRLEPEGITVLDSLSDRRASDVFKNTERALLIGGERYGEGLDIPGRGLVCVIVEKINESMTRGPLAEARKNRTKFSLFDFDFPLRMIWLKQRIGRLVRSPTDSGAIVIFDSRFHQWSPGSRAHVVRTLQPIPVRGGDTAAILREMSALRNTLLQ
jgi:ATP-dependent DNA helicase DinG